MLKFIVGGLLVGFGFILGLITLTGSPTFTGPPVWATGGIPALNFFVWILIALIMFFSGIYLMRRKSRIWVLTIPAIAIIVIVIASLMPFTGGEKIANAEWIGTGIKYGQLTVELVPTDNAKPSVGYIVELWEKDRIRTTALVRWSQPEINAHTSKWISFPLTKEEFNVYRYSTEDLSNVFSVKVRKYKP